MTVLLSFLLDENVDVRIDEITHDGVHIHDFRSLGTKEKKA